MKPRLRCRRAVLLTTAAGVVVGALALGGPAFADSTTVDASTTAPATADPTPAATPATTWSSTAGAMPVDTGTEMDSLPSYGASSPTTPIQLGTVQAGTALSFDLRPTNAAGATYTLTNVDGTPFALDPTVTFRDGVLSGTATTPGTFTARVTATTPCGTATEWVSGTVVAGPAASVGVEGSRAWSTDAPTAMSAAGSTSITQGGSLVLTAWLADRFGNHADGTARATVTSDQPTDVIVDGPTGWVVSFPQASTHVITVTVDAVSTSFTVEVVPAVTGTGTPSTGSSASAPVPSSSSPSGVTARSGSVAARSGAVTARSGDVATPALTPATPSASTPATGTDGPASSAGVAASTVSSPSTSSTGATAPVDVLTPAPISAHVTTAASTDPVSGSTLASTGSTTSGPLAWALGLAAAGAAVTGLRFRRRRRH